MNIKHARGFRTPFAAIMMGILLAGCGGKKVEVVEPAPPPPPPPPPPVVEPEPEPEVLVLDLARIHFDFDKSDIRDDATATMTQNAELLLGNPEFQVLVEGHCDERGTVEYNMALGDKRAEAAKDFLIGYGVASDRVSTISYGKGQPLVEGVDDETWQMNRRDDFNTSK